MARLTNADDFASPSRTRAREGPRPSSDEFRAIDVNVLSRHGVLADEAAVFVHRWPSGANIHVIGGASSVELVFEARARDEEPEHVRQTVALERTPCNYGGTRPWFKCPECSRRVGKLYGGRRFLCRHCTGFAYASTRERAHDRKLERAQDIRMRLGGSANMFEPFPPKPPRMRWSTYERLRHQCDQLWHESLVEALAIATR